MTEICSVPSTCERPSIIIATCIDGCIMSMTAIFLAFPIFWPQSCIQVAVYD